MLKIDREILNLQKIIEEFTKNSDFPKSTSRLYLIAINHFLHYIEVHRSKFEDCCEGSLYYYNFLEKIYSYNTFISYSSALQQVLTWGIATNIIDSEININLPHLTKQRGLVVDNYKDIAHGELLKLVNFAVAGAEDLRDLIVLNLILYHNLSASQLVRLTIFDISKNEGVTKIFISSKGKKDKIKSITIKKNLKTLLIKYIDLITQGLGRKNLDITKLESIFISFSNNNYGTAISEKTITRIVQKRITQAQIEFADLTINDIKGKLFRQAS